MQHITPNSCGTAVPRQAQHGRLSRQLPGERSQPEARAVPVQAGRAAAPGAAAAPPSTGKGRWAARSECGGSGLRITCSGGGAELRLPPPPVNRIPRPAAGTAGRAALPTCCCRRTGTRTPLAARAGLGPSAPPPSHLPRPGAARP